MYGADSHVFHFHWMTDLMTHSHLSPPTGVVVLLQKAFTFNQNTDQLWNVKAEAVTIWWNQLERSISIRITAVNYLLLHYIY